MVVISLLQVNAMWSGEIPYLIDGFDYLDRAAILIAINSIEEKCNLT